MGENLNAMEVGELVMRARRAGIPGADQMSKSQLIEALDGGEQSARNRGSGDPARDDRTTPHASPQQYPGKPGNPE